MRWILGVALFAAAGSAVGAEPPLPAPVRIDPAEGAKAAFARAGNRTPVVEPYIVSGEKWIQMRVNEFPDFGGPPMRWMTFFAIAPSTGQIRCVTVPPAKPDGNDEIAYRLNVGGDYARHAVLLTLCEIRCRVGDDPDYDGTELQRTTWAWNLETGELTRLFTTSGERDYWHYATLARIADSFDYDTIWTDDPAKKWRNRLRLEPRPGNPRPSRTVTGPTDDTMHVAAPERTFIAAHDQTIDDGWSLSRYSFDDPKQVVWRQTSADYRRQAGRGGHVDRIAYGIETAVGPVFPILFDCQDGAAFTTEIWLINVADGTFNRRVLPDAVLPSIVPFISTSYDGRYIYALEHKDDIDLAEIFFDVTNDRILHRSELPADQKWLDDNFTGFLAGRGVRTRLRNEQIELFDLATPERCEIIFDFRKLAGRER